jgi:hypothetical protein
MFRPASPGSIFTPSAAGHFAWLLAAGQGNAEEQRAEDCDRVRDIDLAVEVEVRSARAVRSGASHKEMAELGGRE